MVTQAHWEGVYRGKAERETSWYREHLATSLALIDALALDKATPVIDIGGGRATLVDDLLARGYTDLAVLDLSESALAQARERLGAAGAGVAWHVADATRAALPEAHYGLWHDRAVFHFLMSPEDRQAYVRKVLHSVRPGGHVIVATFAEDGPLQCSGLPVMRYDADGLHAEFGEAFTLVGHEREVHHTPMGSTQQFTYCYCRKALGGGVAVCSQHHLSGRGLATGR